MPLSPAVTQDILATTVLLGGAICILAFALFSYMGVIQIFGPSPSAFYTGKHVLITGGSSGIGKELARILISSGASVTLVARDQVKLENTANELSPPGESDATTQRVNIVSTDCSNVQAVEQMTEKVEREFGPVDILVNSAGNATGGYFDDVDSKWFDQMMKSNYFTHVYPTHSFFKRMTKRRSGHIVFVSSMAGQTGVFGQSAYCASKYAIRGLAETLYFEGKPFGIHITIVFPPDTDTPGHQDEISTMPKETLKISETGSLFSAKKVAQTIADGVRRKQFRVTVGFIGYLLGVLSAGLTPGVSISDVLLAPITRAITPFFLWDQNSTIRKGHTERFPDVKDINENNNSLVSSSSVLTNNNNNNNNNKNTQSQ